MVRSRFWALLLVIGGVFMFAWASRPPDAIVFNRSCQIAGLRDRLSAALYGDTFWQAQLNALRIERDRQTRLPAGEAHDATNNEVGDIERRMNRLATSDSSIERQAAWRLEQRRRLESIGWLTSCEPVIAGRLSRR